MGRSSYFGDNEAIKFALAPNLLYYSDDPDQMWWLFYAVAQGGFFHGGGNYIKGGSQVLSNQLVDRIRVEGGVLIYGSADSAERLMDARALWKQDSEAAGLSRQRRQRCR